MQCLICYESKMHDGRVGIYTVGTKLGKIFLRLQISTKELVGLKEGAYDERLFLLYKIPDVLSLLKQLIQQSHQEVS